MYKDSSFLNDDHFEMFWIYFCSVRYEDPEYEEDFRFPSKPLEKCT